MSTQITPFVGPHGLSIPPLPMQVQRAAQRDLEREAGAAMVIRLREQARAALATEALEATGFLTALEGQLIETTPLGEARYRAIVDSFVMGATRSIRGL